MTNEMLDERDELDARGALLPEAGGVCFTDLWSKTGAKICLTARGANAMEALDDLVASVRYAMDAYGMTVDPPQVAARKAQAAQEAGAPAPAPTPAKANGTPAKAAAPAAPTAGTGEEIETFHVDKIEVVMSPKGQKYVKCFGGPFTKFGVSCWPEVAGELWNLDDMGPGETYNVDLTAKALKQDGKVKKVIALE